MIKSQKRTIYAILKDADVTEEELLETFIGVESLMNSKYSKDFLQTFCVVDKYLRLDSFLSFTITLTMEKG